jgi:hypothetical protein
MKKTIKITESQMKKIIDRISEGEYPMDEATEETITKTTYSKSDVDQAKQKGVGIDVNGTVTPTEDGGMVVTTETEELSDEDIFLEEEGIDPSKGIAGLPMA